MTLHEAFGITAGIAVDSHLEKIFKLLEWCPADCSTIKCGGHVQSWMPQREWGDLNRIYAGLGQLIQSEKKHEVINLAKTLGQEVENVLMVLVKGYARKNPKKGPKTRTK